MVFHGVESRFSPFYLICDNALSIQNHYLNQLKKHFRIYYNDTFCYFQEVIETQEKTIVNLLNAVREQHDQLNNQKIKIKTLEDKVDRHLFDKN